MQLRRVTDPHDPAIEAFGHLQDRVYFEPDMLIPARYIAMMLAQTGGTARTCCSSPRTRITDCP